MTKYKWIISIFFLLFFVQTNAQEPIKKYNEVMRITEYYNESGEMTSFSRINTRKNRVEFYDLSGKIIKTEAYEAPKTEETKAKIPIEKRTLSDEEMSRISFMQTEEINGQTYVIKVVGDLQIMEYYNFDGTIHSYRKYNRGTEEWDYFEINEKE